MHTIDCVYIVLSSAEPRKREPRRKPEPRQKHEPKRYEPKKRKDEPRYRPQGGEHDGVGDSYATKSSPLSLLRGLSAPIYPDQPINPSAPSSPLNPISPSHI